MNKSSLFLIIIFILAIVGFMVYKNNQTNSYPTPTPYTNQAVTPTPVMNIDQQALDKELDQIDQIAKSIQDNNDKDSDLNDLSL